MKISKYKKKILLLLLFLGGATALSFDNLLKSYSRSDTSIDSVDRFAVLKYTTKNKNVDFQNNMNLPVDNNVFKTTAYIINIKDFYKQSANNSPAKGIKEYIMNKINLKNTISTVRYTKGKLKKFSEIIINFNIVSIGCLGFNLLANKKLFKKIGNSTDNISKKLDEINNNVKKLNKNVKKLQKLNKSTNKELQKTHKDIVKKIEHSNKIIKEKIKDLPNEIILPNSLQECPSQKLIRLKPRPFSDGLTN